MGVEVLPFILPNYSQNFTCNLVDPEMDSMDEQFVELMKLHYARLRDIEFLTGFSFEYVLYPEKSVESIQHRLKLPELDGLWDEDKLLDQGEPSGSSRIFTAMVFLVLPFLVR